MRAVSESFRSCRKSALSSCLSFHTSLQAPRQSWAAAAQVVLYNFGVSSWGGLPLIPFVGALIGAATGNLWGPAGFGCWGDGKLAPQQHNILAVLWCKIRRYACGRWKLEIRTLRGLQVGVCATGARVRIWRRLRALPEPEVLWRAMHRDQQQRG